MAELFEVFAAGGRATDTTAIPDFFCSEFERPDKKKAIDERETRFAKNYDKSGNLNPVYTPVVDGNVLLI